MIPVQMAPEYPQFDREVRQRGRTFLQSCPNPNSEQFRRHNYWTKALGQLYAAYNGLCSYTTRYLVYTGTIDHFRPKSKYPQLAYEWSNYRLARQTINTRKGNSEEVLDPFLIEKRWFILHLPSCLIKPALGLPREIRVQVNSTINTLRLNDDERLVEERLEFLVALADGDISLRHLQRHYPFLAQEVQHQGVQSSLREIFAR